MNLASEETWRDFFRAAGAGPDPADALAARLADWRDGDGDAYPNGAEATESGDALELRSPDGR